MTVGFSGTRSGMTEAQRTTVLCLLQELKPSVVRHGDAIGADSEFADLCHELVPRPTIIAHPGVSAKGGVNSDRASNPHNDEIRATKSHFARNRDIVALSDVLIATPYQAEPQDHGGTWYTVSYSQKWAKTTYVVKPNGSLL